MKNQYKQHRLLLILESFVYSSGQMLLGLLLHPYRSMQLLVKNKVLLPFIFYPTFFILSFCALLRVDLVFDFYQNVLIFRFIYQVFLFFFFYWQVALFYLWVRFSRAFASL